MSLKIERVAVFPVLIFILSSLFVGTVFSQSSNNIVEEIQVISFPLDRKIDVPLVPDGRFAGVVGSAKVELDKRGTAEIKVSVKNLPSVFEKGELFAAYVFWAVLSDGSMQRLGELIPGNPKKASNASLKSIINSNTFGMLVTIEPHSLVRLPSRWIVFRGGIPFSKQVNEIKSGAVRCVFSESDFFRARAELTKKEEKERRRTPISLLAAQNAVSVARYAGAETNASESYNEAEVSLKKVVDAWQRKAKDKEIDLLANQTIQLAVVAEKQAVEARTEGIKRVEVIKKSRELNETKDALITAEARADLLKEQLDRITEQKNNLQRDFDAKFSQSSRLESENNILKEEILGLKVENQKLAAQLLIAQTKIRFFEEFPVLENFLKVFGKVRKEENNLVLGFGEEIWLNSESTEMNEEQTVRFESLVKKIAATKYLQVIIFASTNEGEDAIAAQSFVEERAKNMTLWLTDSGIEKNRIRTQTALTQAAPQSALPKTKKTKIQKMNLNKTEIFLTLIN